MLIHRRGTFLHDSSFEAKMGRETSARQQQAHPLCWTDIKEFVESAEEGIRADRERAMMCVAYETLARRGELVTLEVRDIDFHPDGTGQALIRRGKTDPQGQGRAAYLSRETCRWLKIWLQHAGITEGAVFRRLIGQDKVGGALNPGSIAPIFKRVAQWIGVPAKVVRKVSGHSTRVGATQNLPRWTLIWPQSHRRVDGSRRACRSNMRRRSVWQDLGWRERPRNREGLGLDGYLGRPVLPGFSYSLPSHRDTETAGNKGTLERRNGLHLSRIKIQNFRSRCARWLWLSNAVEYST
jgi:integrase